MTIGQNIRRYRKAAGLSQKELAEKIGKTRPLISRYEADATAPRMGTAKKLAAALGVDITQIVSETTYQMIDFPEPNDDEWELICIYRNLTDFGKRAVLKLARDIHEEFAISDFGDD